MKNVILRKRLAYELLLSKYQKKEEELEKKIEKLQNECNHEILITSKKGELTELKGITTRSETFCLLCHEYIAPRKYIPEELLEKIQSSSTIDMNNYPNLSKKWKKSWYKTVRALYLSIDKRKSESEKIQLRIKLLNE